ncbi:hypothetical protein [Pseudomonas sp. TE3610]
MRAISQSLEALLRETYHDKTVSLEEFQKVARDADDRWDRVVEELGQNNTLVSFQRVMDVASHLLHLSLVNIRDEDISDLGKAIVKDAVFAQVEYLRAGAVLSLKLLQTDINQAD